MFPAAAICRAALPRQALHGPSHRGGEPATVDVDIPPARPPARPSFQGPAQPCPPGHSDTGSRESRAHHPASSEKLCSADPDLGPVEGDGGPKKRGSQIRTPSITPSAVERITRRQASENDFARLQSDPAPSWPPLQGGQPLASSASSPSTLGLGFCHRESQVCAFPWHRPEPPKGHGSWGPASVMVSPSRPGGHPGRSWPTKR